MPIHEDTLGAMESAAVKAEKNADEFYREMDLEKLAIVANPTNILALSSAYREQGRELAARIDEIAALTAERDAARAKTEEIRGYWQKAIRQRAKEVPATTAMVSLSDAMRVDCEAECASLTALLNKAPTAIKPLLIDEEPCVGEFSDNVRLTIHPAYTFGDYRRARSLLAEIEAALQPKETPDAK